MRRLYTIVTRPRRTQTYQFDIQKICREMAEHLAMSGEQVRGIEYVAPNFIVEPYDPHQQTRILAASPLRTTNFELDLLPWSREHEMAQLPWIIGMSIFINKFIQPLATKILIVCNIIHYHPFMQTMLQTNLISPLIR